MSSGLSDQKYRIYIAAIYLGVALIALAIYGQASNFGRSMDDHLIFDSLAEIPNDISGFKTIFQSRYNLTDYRPVSMASFQLERMLTGRLVTGQTHTINLMIYIGILWLLIPIMIQAISLSQKKDNLDKTAIFLVAATVVLFCVHPIHANVVSSIKNRDTLLSMFFVSAAVYWLFRMIGRRKYKWEFLVFFLFFILAYFSKRDAIGLVLIAPFTIVLFDQKKWKPVLSFALIAIAVPLTYAIVQKFYAPVETSIIEIDAILYSENPMGDSFTERISAMFSTVLLYMKAFVYPRNYYYYIGYDMVPFPFSGIHLVSSIIVSLALVAITVFSVIKRKIILAFGLFFMGAGMLYCLNFFRPVAGIYSARLVFISSFGFCIVLAFLINMIPRTYQKVAGLVILASILGVFSFNRCSDWQNFESLINADINHLERSHEANRIAGEVYSQIADSTASPQKRNVYLQKSLKHLTLANEIFDGSWKAHFYEGYVQYGLGNTRLAIASLEKSVELNPQFVDWIVELLGDAYYFDQQYSSSVNAYKKVWRFDRNRPDILYKINNVFYNSGDSISANTFCDSLMAADPELYPPYAIKGNLSIEKGDTIQAVIYFRQAIDRGLIDEQVEAFVDSYPLP